MKTMMQQKCDTFNNLHPVGTKVVYVNDFGEEIKSTVKHPAQILSGHTPIVWLEDVSGGYLLERVF